MLTDFRKTALLAGISIALSVVWTFIGEFLIGPHRSSLDLISTTGFLFFILVLESPMPVFLILLSRTGIRPSPSRNLQLLITVLTAILALSLLLFLQGEWRSGIVPDTRGLALSAKFGAWFLVSPGSPLWAATHVISTALQLISRLLTILFFLAFAKQTEPHAMPLSTETWQLKKAAMLAIAARVLMMVLSVLSYMIYAHAARTYGKPGATPRVLSIWRNLLFELPALILPCIIYRCIRNPTEFSSVGQVENLRPIGNRPAAEGG